MMSQDAFEGVRDRLPPGLDVVTLTADGQALRDGSPAAADSVAPEVFWFSLDMFKGGPAAPLFRAALQSPQARWLQSFSAGIDNPSFKAVMQKGVRVTKSDAQAPAIGEYVMAHALSLLHPIAAHARQQAEHVWKPIPFREIADTTWLLVGYGHIGVEIARRLQPFGAELVVVRRKAGSDLLAARVIAQAELPAALPQADVVILACALTDETRDMANAAFFDAMKPGALFLNVGRGDLVVEDDFKAAIDTGVIGHAVLDVFRTEPLPADDWRWDHPRVTVTPHDSPTGSGLLARGQALFLDNLRRYGAGEPLRNEAALREVGL